MMKPESSLTKLGVKVVVAYGGTPVNQQVSVTIFELFILRKQEILYAFSRLLSAEKTRDFVLL